MSTKRSIGHALSKHGISFELFLTSSQRLLCGCREDSADSVMSQQQQHEEDPHDIGERFWEQHQYYMGSALKELEYGRKQSCWSWFLLPTPPYIVDGVERGSSMNRMYALRGDEAAQAFLTFRNGRLRQNYLLIVRAIQSQLRRGNSLRGLLGELDYSKAISSFKLFHRIGRQMNDDELVTACSQVLELAGVKQKKRRSAQNLKGWLVRKKCHSI